MRALSNPFHGRPPRHVGKIRQPQRREPSHDHPPAPESERPVGRRRGLRRVEVHGALVPRRVGAQPHERRFRRVALFREKIPVRRPRVAGQTRVRQPGVVHAEGQPPTPGELGQGEKTPRRHIQHGGRQMPVFQRGGDERTPFPGAQGGGEVAPAGVPARVGQMFPVGGGGAVEVPGVLHPQFQPVQRAPLAVGEPPEEHPRQRRRAQQNKMPGGGIGLGAHHHANLRSEREIRRPGRRGQRDQFEAVVQCRCPGLVR